MRKSVKVFGGGLPFVTPKRLANGETWARRFSDAWQPGARTKMFTNLLKML